MDRPRALRRRLAGAAAVAGLASALASGPVLAVRSASIADLTLAAKGYSHTSQGSSGALVLTVADDGLPAADGWNVTVSSSAFVYSGTNNGTDIPAANLRIDTANAPTFVSGQAIDATNGPKVPTAGATGTLDIARKVLQANVGFGVGTYQQQLDVTLTIPAMSRAGTYTATLSVTITAGP